MLYDRIEKYQNVLIETYWDDDFGSNISSQGSGSRQSALMAAKTEMNVRFEQGDATRDGFPDT